MPSFNAGDTVSVKLNQGDVLNVVGTGTATVTGMGGSFETRLIGSKAIGPFLYDVSVVIACASAGSYSGTTTAADVGDTFSVPSPFSGYIRLAEGRALNVVGTAATGTVQRLDVNGNSLQSWAVGTGTQVIGPYSGTQQFLVFCSAGSIDVNVGDASTGMPQFDHAIPKADIPADFRGVSNGNVATRMIAGRCEYVFDNSAINTWELTVSLAEHADCVRVIFGQSQTGGTASSTPNMLATIYAPTSFADVDAVTFSQGVTVGGSGTWALAAPSADQNMAYTVSDWMQISTVARNDGGTNPLISIRAFVNGGTRLCLLGKSGSDNYDAWASRPVTERQHRIRRSLAGGNQTASAFSGPQVSYCPIIGVQYQARGRVYTIGLWDDSTGEGRDTYIGQGWVMAIAEKINSMNLGFKVETMQCSWSGAGSGVWRNNIKTAFAAGLVPDLTLYKACSPNDISTTITDALLSAARARASLRLADTISGKNTKFAFVNFAPSNTSVKQYAATDAKRIAWNAYLASNGMPCIDVSTPLSGSVDGTGQMQMNATYSIDGIHSNLLGDIQIRDANWKLVLGLLAYK